MIAAARPLRFLVQSLDLRGHWKDHLLLTILTIGLGLVGGIAPYHPDYLDDMVLRVLRSNGNPVIFIYPALVTYLSTIVYLAAIVLKEFAGLFSGQTHYFGQVFAQILRDGIHFYFPGQVVTLLFASLGTNTLYLMAREIFKSRLFAILATFFLLTSVFWLAEAHFFTVDMPLAALTLLTAWVTLLVTRPPAVLRWPHLLLLGVLVGLTTSAKYTGAVVFFPVALTLFFAFRNKLRWLGAVAVVGVTSVGVFFLTNPFIFKELERFQRDMRFHSTNASLGFAGYSITPAWSYYLEILLAALGLPLVLLALAGLVWLFGNREMHAAAKSAVLLFPLTFILVISASQMTFKRYLLPAFPFFALFAAAGLFLLWQQLTRHSRAGGGAWQKTALVLVAVGLMAPNMWNAGLHIRLLAGDDTRNQFARMAAEVGLPDANARIYAGPYIADLFPRGRLQTKWLEAQQPLDLIILDSFSFDRYLYDPALTPGAPPRSGRYDPGFVGFSADALAGRTVLQLTPFHVPKEQIPFSPESLYSPFFPDLVYRSHAGPYIEIYGTGMEWIDPLMTACTRFGYLCQVKPAEAGYYFRQYAHR